MYLVCLKIIHSTSIFPLNTFEEGMNESDLFVCPM